MCIILKRFRTTSCKGEAEIFTDEPRNIPVVSKNLFSYRIITLALSGTGTGIGMKPEQWGRIGVGPYLCSDAV